jgi:ribonuclease HII
MRSEILLPSLAHEQRAWAAGHRYVAGLDEAGRGAWAGPVVAAAVVLPAHDPQILQKLRGVRDSKMLSAPRREALSALIQAHALAWAIGVVPAVEIDVQGIVPATRKAMALALQSLAPAADYLLIDHLRLPDLPLPQHSLPKGDAQVLSIAAASILAKVSRDRMMVNFDGQFPGYAFAQHKGYGTAQHRAALLTRGPCAIHRRSFAPVRMMVSDR